MVARVVEAADVGVGEVLDHGERRDLRRDLRQRHRPEVLLEVAQQRVAHPLAEQHAAGDDHAAERAVGGLPQQQADVGHVAELVDAHGTAST